MDLNPELVPYYGWGHPPQLRPDLVELTKGDRLSAILLDGLLRITSRNIEVSKVERQSFWAIADDYDIHADPIIIQRGICGTLTISEIQEKLGILKELGLVNTNSLFSLRVNIQTIKNRIAVMD